MIVDLCPWNTRMEIVQAYKTYEQMKQNMWTSLWPVLQWTIFIWSRLVISNRSKYLKVSNIILCKSPAQYSIKSGDNSIKYRTIYQFLKKLSPLYTSNDDIPQNPPCDSCFKARIDNYNLCTESYRKFSFETPKVNFDLGIPDYYLVNSRNSK